MLKKCFERLGVEWFSGAAGVSGESRGTMGGRAGRQDRLFYEFDLDEMVPGDHLLRKIDTVLDLSWLRGELKTHYSDIGRPFDLSQTGMCGPISTSVPAARS